MKKVVTTLTIIAIAAIFMFRNGLRMEQFQNGQSTNEVVISGNKTISNDLELNDGVISPGHSPGKIAVTGNFTMSGTAIYKCELKDLTGAGTGHDQIEVSGNTTLGGTLDVVFDGYSPDDADMFDILEYGGTLSGTFSTIYGLPEGWQIDYGVKTPGKVLLYGPNSLLPVETLTPKIPILFYPNPATKIIFFNTPVESVAIHDVQGKEVLCSHNIEFSLDISKLQPGIYIIDINRSTYSGRLVVE